MAREYLPKLTIAIIALSVILVVLATQPSQVAALPSSVPSPTDYGPTQWWYNSTYYCSNYNYYYYWGYPYSYCNYYWNYYGYPYYNSYYGYPYYYSNYYASPSSYTLSVNTDPSNLGTVTGGGTYTQGSSATFSVTQNIIQVSSNERYVFSHWSGDYSGMGTTGTVTVNGAMTITAEYQHQYLLTVNVQPQSAPVPQGAGWFNAGDTATLQNAGQTIGGDGGSRLQFQGWSVDGQGPQSGPSLSVVMNAPHTVTALYQQQYYLNVETDQGVATGTGWYNAGSTAQIYVSTPISTTYGVSIVFNGWQGDIQSSSQSTTVLMDGPKSVVATWGTDATVLYLTIAAVIVAAVLIIAGVIAFMARGRRTNQPQMVTQNPQPPVSQSNTAAGQDTTHKVEHHRRKATENTASTDSSTASTGEPTS